MMQVVGPIMRVTYTLSEIWKTYCNNHSVHAALPNESNMQRLKYSNLYLKMK